MSHTIVEQSDPENPVSYTGELLYTYTSDVGQIWSILRVEGGDELLFINNQLQSSSADEHIYHETLVHSLLAGLSSPKSVLILGGAEGCTTREVLKWPTVERVVQVDWDPSLVIYFQILGAHWNAKSYENPKTEVYMADALDYLTRHTDTYDAIVVDLLDPHSQEDVDFLETICTRAKEQLNPRGGLILNCGGTSPGTNPYGRALLNRLKTVFPDPPYHRAALHCTVPSFLDDWGFAMIVPKGWSSAIRTTQLPEGLGHFTVDTLLDSVRWNGAFDEEWCQFWKASKESSVESPKKLENAVVCDRSQDFEQYGC
jgi:spermidine synthase